MEPKSELMRLQRAIAGTLKELEIAENVQRIADADYQEAYAAFEKANSALVEHRTATAITTYSYRQKLTELRAEAKAILEQEFISDLPEGFSQKREKVVKYDKQGFFKIALTYFPHLLIVNEKAVHDFFVWTAKEQDDGNYVVPENIRSLVSVDVSVKPLPNISDAKLSKLVFEDEAENLVTVSDVVTMTQVQEWQPPVNAIGFLTAPTQDLYAATLEVVPREFGTTKELPMLEEFSPEDESIPYGAAFNGDGTWNGQESWNEDTATLSKTMLLGPAFAVPPTEDINF